MQNHRHAADDLKAGKSSQQKNIKCSQSFNHNVFPSSAISVRYFLFDKLLCALHAIKYTCVDNVSAMRDQAVFQDLIFKIYVDGTVVDDQVKHVQQIFSVQLAGMVGYRGGYIQRTKNRDA